MMDVENVDGRLRRKETGNSLGQVPAFLPKSDLKRVQNCPNLFTEKYKDAVYQESVKMDGSAETIYFVCRDTPWYKSLADMPQGRFGVCTRRNDLPDARVTFKEVYQEEVHSHLRLPDERSGATELTLSTREKARANEFIAIRFTQFIAPPGIARRFRLVRSSRGYSNGSRRLVWPPYLCGIRVELKESRQPVINDRYTRATIRHASQEGRSGRLAANPYAPHLDRQVPSAPAKRAHVRVANPLSKLGEDVEDDGDIVASSPWVHPRPGPCRPCLFHQGPCHQGLQHARTATVALLDWVGDAKNRLDEKPVFRTKDQKHDADLGRAVGDGIRSSG
ncbi:hypothetical protein PG991_000767 [Apiospora marii]|uniref:Uncharacterized protein n=1 Tax=Apiospora marii TaxID=335849 RepID=A0ABR1SSY3_9PEZI